MSFSYLGFQIVEYAFVNPESPYVKDLSFVAFAASDVTKNCTFYFSTANDEYKNSFKSGCHDLTPSATIPTSTATFEQFKKFGTINIY
ncbi:MAG: hypothetical protein EOM50_23375 [Erysipelotrichia bacterium]|nr:hypothetical protein [Erysipelotrichia bacterium]